jgi:GNAT superfamily N-acetyltransferase
VEGTLMEIRLAAPAEAAEAVSIIQECGLEMQERFEVPDWLLPGIPATLASDASAARLYVITEKADGIVGTFALCDIPDDYYAGVQWEEPNGSAAYLHRFAVTRQHQGRGIGALCLGFMEDLLRRRGRRWLRLDATERDPRARAFYERAGYTPRGVARIPVPLPAHPDVVVVCYEKRL